MLASCKREGFYRQNRYSTSTEFGFENINNGDFDSLPLIKNEGTQISIYKTCTWLLAKFNSLKLRLIQNKPNLDAKNSPNVPESKFSHGILLAALSSIFFATSGLIVKVSSIPPMELLCIRGLIQAILIGPLVIQSGSSFLGPPDFKTRALLTTRALIGSLSLVLAFCSIKLIPLADAATVIFTSPVFVSIFACVFLKESCSFFDVSMIGATIIGVIFVAQPSLSMDFSMGSVAGISSGLGAAMLTAAAFIVLRQLKTVHYSVVIFWFSTTLALTGATLTASIYLSADVGSGRVPFMTPTSALQISQCLGIGLSGFLGQILLTKALQIENAGPVSVARTLDIVLSFAFEIFIVGESTRWYSYIGALLVVSSVILTALRPWISDIRAQKETVEESESNTVECRVE